MSSSRPSSRSKGADIAKKKKVAAGGSSSQPPAPRGPILFVSEDAKLAFRNSEKVNPIFERWVAYDSFQSLDLENLHRRIGFLPFTTMTTHYNPETIRYFWANFSIEEDGPTRSTTVFSSMVNGQDFTFTIQDICEKLGFSTEGVDPTNQTTQNILRATKRLMGDKWDNRTALLKLYRRQLPLAYNITSYLLHHNVLPRAGRSNDEVPSSHIEILNCMMDGEAINWHAYLFEAFFRLARSPAKILPFARIVTRYLQARGIRIPEGREVGRLVINMSFVQRHFLGSASASSASSQSAPTSQAAPEADVGGTSSFAAPSDPPAAFMDEFREFMTSHRAWQQDVNTQLASISSRVTSLELAVGPGTSSGRKRRQYNVGDGDEEIADDDDDDQPSGTF